MQNKTPSSQCNLVQIGFRSCRFKTEQLGEHVRVKWRDILLRTAGHLQANIHGNAIPFTSIYSRLYLLWQRTSVCETP